MAPKDGMFGSSDWTSCLVLCSPLGRGRCWVWSGPTKMTVLSSKCNADGFRVKFHFPSKTHTDTHPQKNPSPNETDVLFLVHIRTQIKVMKKISFIPAFFVPAALFRWIHKQLNTTVPRPPSIFQPCGVSQWHLKFEWSRFKNNPLFKISAKISHHSISEGYSMPICYPVKPPHYTPFGLVVSRTARCLNWSEGLWSYKADLISSSDPQPRSAHND